MQTSLEQDIARVTTETHQAVNGSAVPAELDPVVDRMGRIAELNGHAIRETTESAVRRCLDAGVAVTEVAHELQQEATELAAAMRKHGMSMAQSVDDFTTMATRVAASMRSTRLVVFGANGS